MMVDYNCHGTLTGFLSNCHESVEVSPGWVGYSFLIMTGTRLYGYVTVLLADKLCHYWTIMATNVCCTISLACRNPLVNDKILDLSKLKGFADNKRNVRQLISISF